MNVPTIETLKKALDERYQASDIIVYLQYHASEKVSFIALLRSMEIDYSTQDKFSPFGIAIYPNIATPTGEVWAVHRSGRVDRFKLDEG